MIIDNELLFSNAQAITATANSTNVYDLGVARDIGVGEELWGFVQVTTAFTDSSSNSTVAVSLVTDDNTSLSSPATVQTLFTLPALSAAGTLHFFRIPVENINAYQRYIGLTYTVANGDLSTGAITAGIVKDIQKVKNYASGYSIS